MKSHTQMITSKGLQEEVGDISIQGMDLSFTNSKIGLKKAFSEIEDKYLYLKVMVEHDVKFNHNIIENLFLKLDELSKLFVKKKELTK